MAGREPGFRMGNDHRVKIKNSNILNALIEHVDGKREMSATQVSAGLGLLKKVMPDLGALSLSGDDENPLNIVHTIRRIIVDPRHSDSESIPAAPEASEV